jgi:hypothetical protein
MEDVTVKKPSAKASHLESHKWTPYASPIPFADEWKSGDCVEAVSQQEVLLCEIMAPCGYFLWVLWDCLRVRTSHINKKLSVSYGTSGISGSKLQPLNAKIVAKLLNWKVQLPPSLELNLNDHTSPYLPHVLLLQ